MRSAIVWAVVLAGSVSRVYAEAPAPQVLVHVVADRNVSELDRTEADSDITLAVTRTRCGAVVAADAEQPHDLELRVRLTLWRESEEPGGEPVFDPATGGYKPNIVRKVETAFDVEVRAPGQDAPLAAKPFRFARTVAGTAVEAFDPRFVARRRALERIGDESAAMLCKQVRKLRKR